MKGDWKDTHLIHGLEPSSSRQDLKVHSRAAVPQYHFSVEGHSLGGQKSIASPGVESSLSREKLSWPPDLAGANKPLAAPRVIRMYGNAETADAAQKYTARTVLCALLLGTHTESPPLGHFSLIPVNPFAPRRKPLQFTHPIHFLKSMQAVQSASDDDLSKHERGETKVESH